MTTWPRGWQTRNIAELIESYALEIGDGYRAKNTELGQTGLPFLRISNLIDYIDIERADILCEESVIKAGSKVSQPFDVVLTTKGTVGRFAFVKSHMKKFVYSPQLSYWRVLRKDVVDPRFLFYWAHGKEHTDQTQKVKGLTDMADYVSLADQRKMVITLPPFNSQQKISAVLSAYDDLIENNRRRIQLLEEMARALYREWFVHFRFPGHVNIQMVDSELGEIPEGWRVGAFTDIIEIHGGGTPRTNKPEYWNGEIPFFTPKDIRNGLYVLDTERRITREGLENCRSNLYPRDTVFITARGTVGQVVMPAVSMAMSQTSYALLGMENYSQLFTLFKTLECVRRLKRMTHGAVFDTIIVDTIRALRISIPPDTLTWSFDHNVKAILEMSLVMMKQVAALQAMRDSLLPRVVSGEIDVSNLKVEGPRVNHKTSKYSDRFTLDQWLDGDDDGTS